MDHVCCVSSVGRDQKRVSDPLELELEMDVSWVWVLTLKPRSSGIATRFLTTKPSLQDLRADFIRVYPRAGSRACQLRQHS